MVVREGAELVLILRAVELSSAGVQVWIGTALGIAIAVAVGVFFFQGTLRIPLHRFFAATSVILMVVAFQLALTGVHELSEAIGSGRARRKWPSSARSYAMNFFFRRDFGGGGAAGAARMVQRTDSRRGCRRESGRAANARMGIQAAAAMELCGGDFCIAGGIPSRPIRVWARSECTVARADAHRAQ